MQVLISNGNYVVEMDKWTSVCGFHAGAQNTLKVVTGLFEQRIALWTKTSYSCL